MELGGLSRSDAKAEVGYSVVSQPEAAHAESLLDLLDALAAEVGDRAELVLRLLDEIADRLHAGALQAVVGPDTQLELLDQDVVHAVRGGRDGAEAARGLARTVP